MLCCKFLCKGHVLTGMPCCAGQRSNGLAAPEPAQSRRPQQPRQVQPVKAKRSKGGVRTRVAAHSLWQSQWPRWSSCSQLKTVVAKFEQACAAAMETTERAAVLRWSPCGLRQLPTVQILCQSTQIQAQPKAAFVRCPVALQPAGVHVLRAQRWEARLGALGIKAHVARAARLPGGAWAGSVSLASQKRSQCARTSLQGSKARRSLAGVKWRLQWAQAGSIRS